MNTAPALLIPTFTIILKYAMMEHLLTQQNQIAFFRRSILFASVIDTAQAVFL